MTGGRLDPVTLSVLSSALSGIAEEMGAVLIRAAYSSNIKERRDCSTALFDADGRMVAQAEHIPCTWAPCPGGRPRSRRASRAGRHVRGQRPLRRRPLPDHRTLVAHRRGGRARGLRGHARPPAGRRGMAPRAPCPPPRATYGRRGSLVRRAPRAGGRGGPRPGGAHPGQRPHARRSPGGPAAQIAANRLAERAWARLAERRGLDVVRAAFGEVIAYTERRTREALQALPDGSYAAESEIEGDGMTDDDIPIRVRVTLEGDTMEVDFEGTSGSVGGNVNCPLAVTRSAYFALRVLLPGTCPPTPAPTPRSPSAPGGQPGQRPQPSAVVAGNVETSQRIADTVLLALGEAADLPAQGQGTMNNLVIGEPAGPTTRRSGAARGRAAAAPASPASTWA